MIVLTVIIFLGLLVIGLDVGFSMIIAALVGMLFRSGVPVDTVMAPVTLVHGVDTAALVTVPLFVLAGEVMNRGGMTHRLIEWSTAMVGHFRGSLTQVSLLTNLVMGGITGSAVADATASGSLLIPAMKKEGYGAAYGSAVIAAGAMIGPIIPPSIPMIVYAVMSNVSVGRLFLAGIAPGLLLFVGYMAICGVIARKRGFEAKPAASWKERINVTQRSVWALMIPILIVLGIRSGLVTETEAAGVICTYALLVGLLVYRDLKARDIGDVLFHAGRTAAVILFLIAAAGPFSWLINEAQIAQAISGTILSVSQDKFVVLLLVNLLLFAVGMVLEPLPALVMLVPTLLPIQSTLGIHPIQFAMVVILNLMIGMLHPPVGLLIFITSAIARVSIWSVTREILPFLCWSLFVLLLVSAIPQVSLLLPSLAFGGP
jgi:tripartite ATP-independent transporter DctM subunit